MPQAIVCPSCSATLEVPPGGATLVQCPACGATISLAADIPPIAAGAPKPRQPFHGMLIAKGSWDYRWRRFLLVVVLLGYGGWSLYDGYIRMPAANEAAKQKYQGIEKLPYPGLDIPFNQKLGVALPPVALLYLGWVLYASRGQYRFDGTTLTVPGHPPVNIKAIRKIDKSKWDRKGIAYVHYQATGSANLAVLKLDDFVYDRKPTDGIYDELSFLTVTSGVPSSG